MVYNKLDKSDDGHFKVQARNSKEGTRGNYSHIVTLQEQNNELHARIDKLEREVEILLALSK